MGPGPASIWPAARLAEISCEAVRPPGGQDQGRGQAAGGLDTGSLFRAALQVRAVAPASEFSARVLSLEARLSRAAIELSGTDEAVQAIPDLARGLGLARTLADESCRAPVIAKQASMPDAVIASGLAVHGRPPRSAR